MRGLEVWVEVADDVGVEVESAWVEEVVVSAAKS